MRLARFALAGLTILLLSIVETRADQIIYSNFGPGQSYNTLGSYDITNPGTGSEFLAFSFTPTANYSFTNLDVAINQGNGAVTADVYLAEDSAGQPGLVLYSASLAVPQFGGIASAPVGLTPVDLLANQTYWLFLGTPIPDATLGWFLNSTGAVGPLETNNGQQWIPGSPDTQGAFSISGDLLSVPEPDSLILASLGVLSLLGYRCFMKIRWFRQGLQGH